MIQGTSFPLACDAKMAAQQVAAANEKVDDIENCLRRNNVHIVGFPERVEDWGPTAFVE